MNIPVSILSKFQKKQLFLIVILTLWLLPNSAYLFFTSPAASESIVQVGKYDVSTYGMIGAASIHEEIVDPNHALPHFYQIMLLTHLAGGLVLAGLAIAFVLQHVPSAWKRKNQNAILLGTTLTACAVLLAITGLFILTEANSVENRWIFYSHRALAVLLPLAYILHRLFAYSPISRTRLAYTFSGLAVVLLLLLGIHQWSRGELPMDSFSLGDKHIAYAAEVDDAPLNDPFIPFSPNNLGDPNGKFHPSAVTTTSGDYLPRRQLTLEDIADQETIKNDLEQYGFVKTDSMGAATCKRCHEGIVEQWTRSAHRFSSFNNPFYKASIDNLRTEPNGKQRSQWCGACHDPVMMFGGKMLSDIDPHWPEAQAGLTCLSCHTIDAIHGKEGNGNYNISDAQPSPYLFHEAKSGMKREIHDYLIKAKPTVHKNQMLKPFFRSSEYCLTCHKVSLDVPINNYKWLRGQNEYDNWHNSGVARNAARTFYLPDNVRSCQDCHMPLENVKAPDVSAKNGKVKSHTFFAANTALPYIRDDEESLRAVESVLKNNSVIIDIFAVRNQEAQEKPIAFNYENAAPAPIQAGDSVLVDVVVRNYSVGHTFPGGTLDSNECWIEFQVKDESGASLLESGGLNENKVVDPAAHFYKVLFVNKESQPALVRDPQNFHAAIYTRAIGPGAADVVSFQFKIPQEWQGRTLEISAKLLWRKFNTPFSNFVYEREPLLAARGKTDLPITEISTSGASLNLGAENANVFHQEMSDPRPMWMRYNDYGIANLLKENNHLADWAFQKVDELAPERADGPRNLARIAIQEGAVEEAYRLLEECETRKPGDPQSAWFWGLAKKEEGLYIEAANAFERVLAYFPEDRAAWNQLGRTHYLNGDYHKSLETYLNLLKIDPEDQIAHYHRMLCYRALGEIDKANVAQQAYEKYQIDENAMEFTQRYRLNNPIDNDASQKIRVIELKQKENQI
ncbi:MAG: cytochrome c3 family protein [Candidatus Hinthialibacter antarcticus]|nr:cytochrome c3 family protein [Candidatus Hinthialibacter antarcticus]